MRQLTMLPPSTLRPNVTHSISLCFCVLVLFLIPAGMMEVSPFWSSLTKWSTTFLRMAVSTVKTSSNSSICAWRFWGNSAVDPVDTASASSLSSALSSHPGGLACGLAVASLTLAGLGSFGSNSNHDGKGNGRKSTENTETRNLRIQPRRQEAMRKEEEKYSVGREKAPQRK